MPFSHEDSIKIQEYLDIIMNADINVDKDSDVSGIGPCAVFVKNVIEAATSKIIVNPTDILTQRDDIIISEDNIISDYPALLAIRLSVMGVYQYALRNEKTNTIIFPNKIKHYFIYLGKGRIAGDNNGGIFLLPGHKGERKYEYKILEGDFINGFFDYDRMTEGRKPKTSLIRIDISLRDVSLRDAYPQRL